MPCPEAETLARFAQGLLTGNELETFELHLADCANCLRVAGELASQEGHDDTLPSTGADLTIIRRGESIGRYMVLDLLGAGGMGVVYTGYDPLLDRKVALKLLRPTGGSSSPAGQASSRLLREAQALARVSHPNVVAIYDVGTVGEQVFMAMERVEGSSLRLWLKTPRRWQQIRDAFVEAGRGLAAAHAAGVVHRDFKPDNVLIGADGRVRVTDFGLAREQPAQAGAPAQPRPAPSPTHVDAVAGTPGFVPPEVLAGQPADARSDQFSFCVSLYEGLYGEKPFPASPRVPEGPVSAEPKDTHVPARLRRALLQGLQRRPEDRFENMEALLDALQRDPLRRAAPFAAGGLGLCLVAGAFVGAHHAAGAQAAADPCHDPASKLDGVWDDAARLRVRRAFTATGVAGAVGTAAYAEKAMDRAGAAWLAAYRDACDATRVRHAQPEAALNLRLDCLGEQRLDLQATAEIIAHPDAKDLSSAIGAASLLPLPTECADARALSVVQQPAPERRPRISALRLRLAQGRALQSAGRSADAIEVLRSLPDEAARLGAPSLEANTLDALSWAYSSLANYKKAIELDARAEKVATAAHLDQLAARAVAELATDQVFLGVPRPEIDATLGRAREALARAGAGGTAEFTVEQSMQLAESSRGHNAEAAAHARRALELIDELRGKDSINSLNAANNLATALEPLGQYDEMVALFRRAIAASDSLLGPKNLRALVPRLNLAESLVDLGRLDEADQALGQLFAQTSSDHDAIAIGLAVQANLQAIRGQRSASLQSLGRALDMAERLHVLANAGDVDLHRYAVEAYLRDGRPDQALAEYEKYLAHQDIAADSSSWVAFLRLGGWAQLEVGQPRKALPILERALALGTVHSFYPGWVARLRYQLAKALVDTHGDRGRATALARAAHDELLTVPEAKSLLAEIDAWRATAEADHPASVLR